MRKMLFATIAVLALVGAACSSDSTTVDTGADGTPAPTSAAAEGCTDANATDLSGEDPFTIGIEGLAFHPDCVKAASEASLTIENTDTVDHTFTIDSANVDVPIPAGQSVEAESAGLAPDTYEFHCSIHTSMTGTIIVV